MKKLINAVKSVFTKKAVVEEKAKEPVAPVRKGPLHEYRMNKNVK